MYMYIEWQVSDILFIPSFVLGRSGNLIFFPRFLGRTELIEGPLNLPHLPSARVQESNEVLGGGDNVAQVRLGHEPRLLQA